MSEKNIFKRLFGHAEKNAEYVLVCFVFVLALACAVLDRFWLHRSDEFLGTLIFEIAIFLIPLFVYFTLTRMGRAEKLTHELNISKISYKIIFFPLVCCVLLISGTLLLDMLFFGIYDITDRFSLYGQFTANGDGSLLSHIYMILTFAIIPSVFEEIVFRRLLTRRLAGEGIFISVFVSALFYALTPMSPRLLPSFFFSGIIYCLIFILTGSLVTSCATHILFNLYCIYLRTNIANYFVSSSDVYILVILSLVVFLIFAIIFCKMVYKMLIAHAKSGKSPPRLPDGTSGFSLAAKRALAVFKYPANIITLAVYAAFVIIFGFFA